MLSESVDKYLHELELMAASLKNIGIASSDKDDSLDYIYDGEEDVYNMYLDWEDSSNAEPNARPELGASSADSAYSSSWLLSKMEAVSLRTSSAMDASDLCATVFELLQSGASGSIQMTQFSVTETSQRCLSLCRYGATIIFTRHTWL